MRVFGAWFTKDRNLPRGGTLERDAQPETPDSQRITLHLEDRLGFFLADPIVIKRYEKLLESTASQIEAAVRANADEVR
jgi:hypothetical protein